LDEYYMYDKWVNMFLLVFFWIGLVSGWLTAARYHNQFLHMREVSRKFAKSMTFWKYQCEDMEAELLKRKKQQDE